MTRANQVLGVSLATVTMVAVTLLVRLHDTNEQLSTLRAQSSSQTATTVRPTLPAPPLDIGTSKTDVSEPNPQVPSAQTQPARNPGGAEIPEELKAVLAMPEGQTIMRATQKRLLRESYPDLAQELLLSPKEQDELLTLLARQEQDTLEMAKGAAGADVNEMLASVTRLAEKKDAELEANLGSKYATWKHYDETRPIRIQVKELQNLLGSGDNALTPAAANNLIEVLAGEQRRIDSEGATLGRGNGEQQQHIEQIFQRRLDAASAYLSSEQLEAFKEILAKDKALALVIMRPRGSFSLPPR